MQSKDSFFHLFCSTKLLFRWFHDNDCRNIWTFCCIYWILHFFHNTCLTKSTKVAWKKRAPLRDDVFLVKLTPPLHSSHGKLCPQTFFAMTLFITKENRNKKSPFNLLWINASIRMHPQPKKRGRWKETFFYTFSLLWLTNDIFCGVQCLQSPHLLKETLGLGSAQRFFLAQLVEPG